MKRMPLFLIMLFIATGLSAQTFEGTITATNSLLPGRSTEFVMKGDQTVQRPLGAGLADVKVYTDLSANAYYLCTNQQGNLSVLSYFLQGSSRQVTGASVSFANITPSGQQMVIDGYTCDGYTGTMNGESFTAWVAPDLNDLNLKAHITPQTEEQLPYANLPGVEGLVLEFSSTYQAATPHPFTTKLSVNAHSVDPTVVQAPATTTVVD